MGLAQGPLLRAQLQRSAQTGADRADQTGRGPSEGRPRHVHSEGQEIHAPGMFSPGLGQSTLSANQAISSTQTAVRNQAASRQSSRPPERRSLVVRA